MPDSFTPLLGFSLQVDGSNLNTWGDDFNNNVITPVENAITGVAAITTTGGTTTLTEGQRVNGILDVRGTLVSTPTIVVAKNVTKWWWVYNGCTGFGGGSDGRAPIQMQITGGSAVTIQGGLHLVFADGEANLWVN